MERFDADTVAGALQQARDARSNPQFDRVISISSVLVNGVLVRGDALAWVVEEPVRVEILPPFAGGARDATVQPATVLPSAG